MSIGSDKDDFWDIEKLLPKRGGARLSPFSAEDAVVTYAPKERESQTSTRPPEERKLSLDMTRGVAATEDSSYIPSGAGLIRKVTVRKFIDKYDFYESFRKSALLYFDCGGTACDFAQFYSYMPQYAHLTPSQKSYYLYWRSEVRCGRYIRTDYSYLYLYVYEILNLPDKIPPEEGICLLCRVWREYRSKLPRLDMYFPIWIEDYCLVHGLSAPTEHISDFIFEAISAAPLKEFYLGDISEMGLSGTEALLAYLSDYDWRKGKFASAEGGLSTSTINRESYKSHMIRAMYLLLSEIWDKRISENAKTTVAVRDAFPNTLCTHSVKCKLEIEYLALTGADELRRDVTAAVRYTENKLRALLGVKSRLATKELPDEYRVIIDRYFAGLIREEQEKRKAEQRPAYESLYEAPDTVMSFTGADEIERISWTTTARLVADSAEEDECAEPPVAAEAVEHTAAATESNAADGTATDIFGLGAEEMSYLMALLGKTEIKSFDTPEDTLAERINDAFAEGFGDIILEPSPEGYRIIDDYMEDVEELICRRLK